MGFLTGGQKKTGMGFLTGEQKKAFKHANRKKLFKRRTEKSSIGFLTGGQKKPHGLSEKAAWLF